MDAKLRWNALDKNDPWLEFVPGSTTQAMQYKMLWSRAMSGELGAQSQGFESRARSKSDVIAEHSGQLEAARREAAELRVLEKEQWPKQSELSEKLVRLVEALGELEREVSSAEPAQPAQN